MSKHSRKPHTAALLSMSLLACAIQQACAQALEPVPPDTSAWKCASCAFDYGQSGYFDLGAIGVDDSSYQYGKYSGLNHSGGYVLADGEYRYRDASADYLDVEARNLGLLSRRVTVKGGRQGLIELTGSFQGIPYYRYNDASSPFIRSGDHLALPANWVVGASTQRMTGLAGSLRDSPIRQKREIAAIGARLLAPKTHWTFDFDYRHDIQKGTDVTGANFLTTSSLLATPVDYTTDQVDAGAQYARGDFRFRLGYYGSFFHDASTAFSWDNPFTPFVPGAGVGRISTAPDNDFNQFTLSGAWQILPSTRLMASGALGVATQDDSFIAATVNPDLAATSLPRASLDGRIDTRNYTVRLTSRPYSQISVVADYTRDQRDNKTAQAAYPQVVTDVYVAGTIVNLPYSFDRDTARFMLDFPVAQRFKVELGAKNQKYDTSNREVARSNTAEGWAQVRSNVSSTFGLMLKFDRSHRMIEKYQTAPTIIAVENPLLQRFDLADRQRNAVTASAYYTPVQSVSLGLAVQRDRGNYRRSQVGLTRASDYSLNLSASWTPTANVSLDTYLTRQLISADQAGSQGGQAVDWFAHTADRVSSGGIGARIKNITPKLDIGANGYVAYTNEVIHMDIGSPDTLQLPNNTFRDAGVRVFANYRLSTRSSLRVDVWHERYRTRDWALDGVTPTTIPNVLTLGVASPNFTVNQLAISYRFAF